MGAKFTYKISPPAGKGEPTVVTLLVGMCMIVQFEAPVYIEKRLSIIV